MDGLIVHSNYKGEKVALTTTETTYYEFRNPSNYQQSYYVDYDNFRFFSFVLRCNSPQNDWYALTSGIFNSPYYSIYPPKAVDLDSGEAIPLLIQNNILYAKGGTAGKTYSISFVIPRA